MDDVDNLADCSDHQGPSLVPHHEWVMADMNVSAL